MNVLFLDPRSTDVISLPRNVALKAAETVQAVAQETVPELERLHSIAWQAGSMDLVSGLDRLIARLGHAGRDMYDFAGLVSHTEPIDPDLIEAPGHGAAA